MLSGVVLTECVYDQITILLHISLDVSWQIILYILCRKFPDVYDATFGTLFTTKNFRFQ